MTRKLQKSPSSQLNQRRASALARLEAQLVSGVKLAKQIDSKTNLPVYNNVPLTESDKRRISHEINVLKSRVS